MMYIRRLVWRVGRKLYCWARRDVSNNPENNGEYWLLSEVTKELPSKALLLDVGANKGEWSVRASSLVTTASQATICAFEPCADTRKILTDRFSGRDDVQIFGYALSSADGEADFFSNGAGSGTNSLNAVSGPMSERVQLITLDSFLEMQGIDRKISMLKVDTEGYDLEVLKGARGMLAAGRIDCVQFEYNWRWLINKASLRDVFELIQGMPYRLGKLVGSSIEFYPHWHFELDRYFEGNYVLIRVGSRLLESASLVHFDESNAPTSVNGFAP